MDTYIKPAYGYSLYDLYRDIESGRRNEFKYSGKSYHARRGGGLTWVVTALETGHTATCPFYMGCMTDFHGVAACLDAEKRTITFNKEGTII